MDPIGRAGPHPDLVQLVVDHLERSRQRRAMERVASERRVSLSPVTTGQIEVLQQRTFQNHETLRFGRRSESAWLALLRQEETLFVVLCLAASENNTNWRIAQLSVRLLAVGNPPELPPYFQTALGGLGRYVLGVLVRSPEVTKVRLKLADGTILEDNVSNSSALLFVTFRSAEQWSGEATLEILDRGGRLILSERKWVHPDANPPDMKLGSERSPG